MKKTILRVIIIALLSNLPMAARAKEKWTQEDKQQIANALAEVSPTIKANSLSYSPKAGSSWTVPVKIISTISNIISQHQETICLNYEFTCTKGDGHISLVIPETKTVTTNFKGDVISNEQIGPFNLSFELAPDGTITNLKETSGKDVTKVDFIQNLFCLFPKLPTEDIKDLPYLPDVELKEISDYDRYLVNANVFLGCPEDKSADKIPNSLRLDQYINCSGDKEHRTNFNVVFQEAGVPIGSRRDMRHFTDGTIGLGHFIYDKKLGSVSFASYHFKLKKGLLGQVSYEYAVFVDLRGFKRAN